MDIQKNLKVLQQYYVTLLKGTGTDTGRTVRYMKLFAAQDPVALDGVEAKALAACLAFLSEQGFSDLYLNGRRVMGTKYGTVPLELEVCFVVGPASAVTTFRIELFLRANRHTYFGEQERLCGRWHWDKDCGLVATVPLDMSKVIWGVKGAPR